MSTSRPIQDVDGAKKYLVKHNLHGIFEDLAADVITDRPEDPLTYMHDKLGKMVAERGAKAAAADAKKAEEKAKEEAKKAAEAEAKRQAEEKAKQEAAAAAAKEAEAAAAEKKKKDEEAAAAAAAAAPAPAAPAEAAPAPAEAAPAPAAAAPAEAAPAPAAPAPAEAAPAAAAPAAAAPAPADQAAADKAAADQAAAEKAAADKAAADKVAADKAAADKAAADQAAAEKAAADKAAADKAAADKAAADKAAAEEQAKKDAEAKAAARAAQAAAAQAALEAAKKKVPADQHLLITIVSAHDLLGAGSKSEGYLTITDLTTGAVLMTSETAKDASAATFNATTNTTTYSIRDASTLNNTLVVRAHAGDSAKHSSKVAAVAEAFVTIKDATAKNGIMPLTLTPTAGSSAEGKTVGPVSIAFSTLSGAERKYKDGTYRIKILSGENLLSADFAGKSDPFVTVANATGTQLFKSAVIDDNLNPVWTDARLALSASQFGDAITFTVMDADVTSTEPLGVATVSAEDAKKNQVLALQLTAGNFEGLKKKSSLGVLNVSFWYGEVPEVARAAPPAAAAPAPAGEEL